MRPCPRGCNTLALPDLCAYERQRCNVGVWRSLRAHKGSQKAPLLCEARRGCNIWDTRARLLPRCTHVSPAGCPRVSPLSCPVRADRSHARARLFHPRLLTCSSLGLYTSHRASVWAWTLGETLPDDMRGSRTSGSGVCTESVTSSKSIGHLTLP